MRGCFSCLWRSAPPTRGGSLRRLASSVMALHASALRLGHASWDREDSRDELRMASVGCFRIIRDPRSHRDDRADPSNGRSMSGHAARNGARVPQREKQRAKSGKRGKLVVVRCYRWQRARVAGTRPHCARATDVLAVDMHDSPLVRRDIRARFGIATVLATCVASACGSSTSTSVTSPSTVPARCRPSFDGSPKPARRSSDR
jgi:hypothetical protein